MVLFQGSASSRTSAKLTALFQQSLLFAPCMLLLGNVEVLCDKDQDSPLVAATLYQLAKSGCSKAVTREGDIREKRYEFTKYATLMFFWC